MCFTIETVTRAQDELDCLSLGTCRYWTRATLLQSCPRLPQSCSREKPGDRYGGHNAAMMDELTTPIRGFFCYRRVMMAGLAGRSRAGMNESGSSTCDYLGRTAEFFERWLEARPDSRLERRVLLGGWAGHVGSGGFLAGGRLQ